MIALLAALIFSIQVRAAEQPLIVQGISQKIASLDPYSLTGIEQFTVTGHVVEPLVRVNPFTKELMPCLATEWKVTGATIVLKLQENAVFHNGQPFTADDVKFTFDSFFDPKFDAKIWQGMFRKIKEVKVIDKYKVEIVMQARDLEVFRNVMTTMRILPRTAYANSDKRWRDSHLIGTGPFRLKAFDSSKSLDLEPHDKWWAEPKPQIRLKVKPVTDFKLAELMLQKKEIDFYEVSADDSLAWKSPSVKKIETARGTGLMIDFNLKNELFKDLKVREGLLMLWNRQGLNEKIFDGQWEVAQDTFSQAMAYYPKGKGPLPYDLKEAGKHFEKAGWKDTDKDSVLDKDGKKLEFTLAVHDAASERWASLYQADAAKAGVKVNLLRVDEDVQWWQILKEGKFDAVADSGAVTDEVHFSTWHSKGDYNFYGMNDPKLDKMIDEFLMKGWDPKQFAKSQNQLILYAREKFTSLPGLFSRHALFIVSPRVQIDEKFPTQAWRWRSKL